MLFVIMAYSSRGCIEHFRVLFEEFLRFGAPFLVAGGSYPFDDTEAVLRKSFGGGAIGGVFGEGAELVEGLAVEVYEGRAREGMGEQAGKACRVAGRQVAIRLHRCQKADGRPHGCRERSEGVGSAAVRDLNDDMRTSFML